MKRQKQIKCQTKNLSKNKGSIIKQFLLLRLKWLKTLLEIKIFIENALLLCYQMLVSTAEQTFESRAGPGLELAGRPPLAEP